MCLCVFIFFNRLVKFYICCVECNIYFLMITFSANYDFVILCY